MPVSVTMPRLGESVTEGTVTRWLKQEGDRVEADEPLLEVSTDKVDTEIPSPAAGVLSRIVVQEDETAEVGSELALIDGDEAGGSDQAESGSAGTTAEDTAVAPASPDQEPEPVAQPESRPESEAEPEPEPQPAAASADAAPEPEPEPEPAAPAATASEQDGGTTVLRMPALGESVTEGTVTRWLKAVGDSVEADEPLLEVSTDKVDTEIPSPVAGTLLEIRVPEDEVAEVGGELAVIGAAGQQPAAAAQPGDAQPAQSEPEPAQPAPSTPSSGAAPGTERTAASLPGSSYGTPDAEAETGNGAGSSQTAVATAQPSDHAPVDAGEGVSVRAPQKSEPDQKPAQQASTSEPAQPAATAPEGDESGGGYVTPLVRKLAAQHDVDLAGLSGTGVGGRIRKQDVLEAAERQRAAAQAAKEAEAARAAQAQAAPSGQPAPAKVPAKAEPSPLRGRTEKMSRMRTLIARRMVESLQVSAQLTTVVEVDVTRIARLRDRAKGDFVATHGVKLSFLPFFALASIEALRVHPNVNASVNMEAGTVTYHNAEHLGIAVDSERGLLVPVIHDAGDLNLAGLAKRIADLAERTRGNKVTPDELSGGTFTLTNTGSRGALFDTPIINQPQVAILGTGAVVKRAVVVNDPNLGEVIAPRSMVYLALSYDHRIVDGADAVRFLGTIKERLEAGQFEAELGLI